MTGEIPVQVLLASPLILLVPAAIFLWFRVPLVKDSAVAVVRMALQFAFVGFYLGWVFEYNRLWLTLLWTLAVVAVAAQTALHRAKVEWRTMGFPVVLSMTVGMVIPLAFIVVLVEGKLPFLEARTTIPFCGMILGHCMKNVIIALRSFQADARTRGHAIRCALALGATRAEALRGSFRRAIEDALAPHVANMAAAGLVTLPGMMTGVMVGGASPLAAVEYQWLLLTAVFAAKALTVVLAISLAIRQNRLVREFQ